MIDLATVTRATFAAHLGERFVMHADERTIDLELVLVEPSPTRPGAPREAFLLRFRATERGHVAQRIYRLSHDALGEMEIFLVPVGPDAVGMRYEAVFS